ncbi:MAG: glutamyl-tRNA reductase [Flavobacteriaceae bacterium]|nr:MAG: glutamyl-tRNA reductase [Flavobacteriaceae bacterium]
MNFRYLSISHHTAPVSRRERFHLDEAEKQRLTDALRKTYPDLNALLILVTCNRTELYFETEATRAVQVRDFFINWKLGKVKSEDQVDFRISDQTDDTVRHLLSVAAGLKSSVLGDAEIIHQIKKAYHLALEQRLQGSLLERCIQTLFRSHKRISNETGFRDGTTSTAYKALKLIGDTFGTEASKKRILFVGAGDIVRQLFKYNTKFGYSNIYITNRTEARAQKLADMFKVHFWGWDTLLANDLSGFDVIISAASHSPSLIFQGISNERKILLVDLAVPGNMAASLRNQPNVVLEDLDSIGAFLQQNRDNRTAATESVREIVEEEWGLYLEWHRMQPFRSLMASRKEKVLKQLNQSGLPENDSEAELKELANRIMRKVLKQREALHNDDQLSKIISEHKPLQTV